MESSKQCMFLLSDPLSDVVSVSIPGEGHSATSHTTSGGGDSHDPEPSVGEISIFMSSVQDTILSIRIASMPSSP